MGRIRQALHLRKQERAAYRGSINYAIDRETDPRHRHELLVMASRQGYEVS